MRRAETQLRKQVSNTPPYNAPWSFFDLSTILLLLGEKQESIVILEKGLINSKDWEVETHLDTLLLIEAEKNKLQGYTDILNMLKEVLV